MKPYSEADLSDLFDDDLVWRRKELSDLKAAVRGADHAAKRVLLRAIIAICYAHWEGYVRLCANRYFEHLSLRRKPFSDFERQIYVNAYLVRLDSLHQSRHSISVRSQLVNDILDGSGSRFAYVHPSLVDTKSNLNTDVIKDICTICSINGDLFEDNRKFIDVLLLKRRNAIAHGQQEFIGEEEIDELIDRVLALMNHFRTLLENKVYEKKYAAIAIGAEPSAVTSST
jgi:hypothetical protein